MKIGIFTSGLENLSLLKILKQYNVDIVVYMNQDSWPIEDKTLDYQEKYIREGIEILKNEGVDKIILHPIWEIKYKDSFYVFPLYQYIIEQNLKYSIVGKIGLFGNTLDLDFIENYLKSYVRTYKKTPRQENNKKFTCFKFYKKDISVWKYNTIILSKRNWMLRKLIKTDLRFFFDSGVDTLIPTTYDIYHFENIIRQKKKKINFQFMSDWKFLDGVLGEKKNKYTLKFIGNGNIDLFLSHKKWNIFIK